MKNTYIVDAIRTPFGRYGGALTSIRTDDLGAVPLQALIKRNPSVDWKYIKASGFVHLGATSELSSAVQVK